MAHKLVTDEMVEKAYSAYMRVKPAYLFPEPFRAALEAIVPDIVAVCAEVAESYEPRCDVCPRGVANAIRHLAQP